MKDLILKRENPYMPSHDGFEDERMDVAEMLDTPGGIERAGVPAGGMFDNPVFESVWDMKYPGDDIYSVAEDRNIPVKNKFFSAVRFFRTLALYVCSGLNK
ncbi:MAG: hypothetical protein LBS42_10420 [Tannerella sp.]|jgi:hypothetical protein|nr:hypothetical protein [Tannerella sp.]